MPGQLTEKACGSTTGKSAGLLVVCALWHNTHGHVCNNAASRRCVHDQPNPLSRGELGAVTYTQDALAAYSILQTCKQTRTATLPSALQATSLAAATDLLNGGSALSQLAYDGRFLAPACNLQSCCSLLTAVTVAKNVCAFSQLAPLNWMKAGP